jgi:hypothetical protein
MKKRQKIIAITAIIVILASTLTVFLGRINSSPPPVTLQTPQQYLSYQGNMSKIFLVATTSEYSEVNQTYTSNDGKIIQKGTSLFIITATLRNDYTSDEPPPLKGIPIAPADGTAYIYLTAQLRDKAGIVNATDVTVPDFSIPSTPGAALVLASGQTASVNIYLSVNQKDVSKYGLNVIFIGDSIPT